MFLADEVVAPWFVYIVLCSDETLYTGITNNLERRMVQHATLRGAKYFRGRKPRKLAYVESGHDRSSASRREAAIKKLSREDKQRLILDVSNEAENLNVGTDFFLPYLTN